MCDHHVRWSSFIGEHHYVDHIYYMIHARPLGLRVPRPYLLYAKLVKLNLSIPRVQLLHPLYLNVEPITPDHHVVSQHEELSQWCILRENTFTMIISERSSYKATVELSKIRCKR